MIFLAPLLATALAVSTADRLAMADRLFSRGDYAEAKCEYVALKGAKGYEADIDFRLVLASYLMGDKKDVETLGTAFLEKTPVGEKADRVRLMRALVLDGAVAEAALRALDRDDVASAVRAEALYHLGVQKKDDLSLFARALSLDPKGRLAPYAKYRHAALLLASDDAATGRKGVAEMMELVFDASSPAELRRDALYSAAAYSYRVKRFGEGAALFRRYLKTFPNDARESEVRGLTALCLLADGQSSQALALCVDDKDETLLYVKAASSLRLGLLDEARAVAMKSLEAFPNGRFRAALELEIARLDFRAATERKDAAAALDAAKRCAARSSEASDIFLLAWAYENAGFSREAEEAYSRVASLAPGTARAAEALYARAMSLLKREQWAAADVALQETLANKSLSPDRAARVLYYRGIAAWRLNHRAEAVGFLKAALTGHLTLDERREARLLLAQDDWEAGREDTALAAYDALVREGALARLGPLKTYQIGSRLTGEGARLCAQALIARSDAEWRQVGFALLGDIETAETNLTAATYAYRKCFDEPCVTEPLSRASLRLGLSLVREDDLAEATRVLKRAVELNAKDAESRAAAYLGLAEVALRRGDEKGAKGYATVIVTLFEKSASAARAKEILK